MKIHTARLTDIEEAAMNGLEEAGRHALALAKERVPVDDGVLKRSGKVVRGDLDVSVKFTAPHAHLQHENLEYHHPHGGQPKFLESAALETDVGAFVADAVRKAMGDG